MPGVKIAAVDHMGVCVSDIRRASAFFRDVLGAEVTEPQLYDAPVLAHVIGIPHAKMFICYARLPGAQFELIQYTSPDGRRVSDLRPCDSGHIHIALHVEGIEELVVRMAQAGFHPAGPVQANVGSHGLGVTYMYGFDGLVIELIDQHYGAADG
jgi:catechol 2,3-dioxygenase-like lactoylglutathione lyase family enzyme